MILYERLTLVSYEYEWRGHPVVVLDVYLVVGVYDAQHVSELAGPVLAHEGRLEPAQVLGLLQHAHVGLHRTGQRSAAMNAFSL